MCAHARATTDNERTKCGQDCIGTSNSKLDLGKEKNFLSIMKGLLLLMLGGCYVAVIDSFVF